MARPSKSAAVITLEGKSHRTKKEIAVRKSGEASMLTGERMKERGDVRKDMDAHKEFLRLRKLFQAIEKDDALYGETINDYCLLHSKRLNISCKIGQVDRDLEYLESGKDTVDFMDYLTMREKLFARREKLQAQELTIMDKMRAIEDKNLMNIQSALRSVPKKPEGKKSALMEALGG